MNLAFCLEMLYAELPFAQKLQAARRDGIEAFEMWAWKDKDVDELADMMHRLQMRACNLSGNRRFGMVEPGDRQAFLRELRESAAVAGKLGCPRLMLLTQPLLEDDRARPVPVEFSAQRATDEIIACGREAGRLADELKLGLVIEPLNDVLDHPGYFLNASNLAFRIIREINHPRVKLLYDVYHMAMMEEDILRDLEDNIGEIGYLHIADKPGRHEPGSGEIDFSSVRALLERLDFQGTVGFEFSPSAGNSPRAVKRTLQEFCEYAH